MFYTLILSLEYKRYKDPATVSIMVNEKIIDSFDVDHDKNRTTKMLSYLEKSCLEKICLLNYLKCFNVIITRWLRLYYYKK